MNRSRAGGRWPGWPMPACKVILICASRGERGSITGPARDDRWRRVARWKHARRRRLLGIAHLIVLDHPDGDLQWAHVTEFHAEIVMALRRYDPAAVITFGEDGLYLASRPCRGARADARPPCGRSAPSPLLSTTSPCRAALCGRSSIGPRPEGGSPPRRAFGVWCPTPSASTRRCPTLVVDVGDWVPRKLAAIRCHRTQMGSDHPFDQIDEADARRWLGVEHFHRAPGNVAEAPVLESLCRSL